MATTKDRQLVEQWRSIQDTYFRTSCAIDRALETVAAKSQPPVSTEFERVTTEITLGTSVEDALSARRRPLIRPRWR